MLSWQNGTLTTSWTGGFKNAPLPMNKYMEEIMEPISIATGASAVLKAIESINKIRADADKLAPDDARYYGTWINVASEAIKGLEQEYIEILVEAARCEPSEPQQKERLLARINTYIHRELLRPQLLAAIVHLREGRQALQQHADQWHTWPSVKSNRANALTQYDQLLNTMQGYLGSLGDYGGASAVGLNDLYIIQSYLLEGFPAAFMEKVDDMMKNLNKAQFMEITGECARAIETLRVAFR
jgi:hypothetical protein